MSSCCTSSLNCTAFFTRSCICEEPASWKNHSKIVRVFSCEIGRIKFVDTLLGYMFTIKFGNTQK